MTALRQMLEHLADSTAQMQRLSQDTQQSMQAIQQSNQRVVEQR